MGFLVLLGYIACASGVRQRGVARDAVGNAAIVCGHAEEDVAEKVSCAKTRDAAQTPLAQAISKTSRALDLSVDFNCRGAFAKNREHRESSYAHCAS